MRRATVARAFRIEGDGVSIHARHATGDTNLVRGGRGWRVSIHARHATGDVSPRRAHEQPKFQFTPVMRRATVSTGSVVPSWLFQFTPVMRRATGVAQQLALRRGRFNSRPSCDGRQVVGRVGPAPLRFQFTPVMRRATKPAARLHPRARVSIHARHATGDCRASASLCIS